MHSMQKSISAIAPSTSLPFNSHTPAQTPDAHLYEHYPSTHKSSPKRQNWITVQKEVLLKLTNRHHSQNCTKGSVSYTLLLALCKEI